MQEFFDTIYHIAKALDNTGMLAVIGGGGLIGIRWLKGRVIEYLEAKRADDEAIATERHIENTKKLDELVATVNELTIQVTEHNQYGLRISKNEVKIDMMTDMLRAVLGRGTTNEPNTGITI